MRTPSHLCCALCSAELGLDEGQLRSLAGSTYTLGLLEHAPQLPLPRGKVKREFRAKLNNRISHPWPGVVELAVHQLSLIK
jgi:hypothetical protein